MFVFLFYGFSCGSNMSGSIMSILTVDLNEEVEHEIVPATTTYKTKMEEIVEFPSSIRIKKLNC